MAGTIGLLVGFIPSVEGMALAERAPISGTPLLREQKLMLLKEWGERGIRQERLGEKGIHADSEGLIVNFSAFRFDSYEYYQTDATCRDVYAMGNGYNLNIYVENSLPDGPKNTVINSVQTIRTEFINNILPKVTQYFGDYPGGHFTILIMDIIDGDSSTYVSGYFDTLNEASGSESNSRHMIYMNYLPWTSVPPASTTFYGTLAHELQHFIHFFIDPLEETWVEEGLSGLARFVCGYGHQASHVTYFSQYPETSLVLWSDDLANYGATYLFMLYLGEHYGGSTLTRNIVANTSHGITGINNALTLSGYGARMNDIFKNWVVANYLNSTSIGGGIYGYTDSFSGISSAPGNLTPTVSYTSYPATSSGSLSPYAAHYVKFANLGGAYDTFMLIPYSLQESSTQTYSYTATSGSLNLSLSGIDSGLGMEGVQNSGSGSTPVVATDLSATSCFATSGGTCSGGGGSSSGGGGCFIATAAFGSPLAKEVGTLRRFRDRYLITHPLGRLFIALYYKWSPPIAEQVAKSQELRAVVRMALVPVVGLSRASLETPWESAAGAWGLALFFAMVAIEIRRDKIQGDKKLGRLNLRDKPSNPETLMAGS